MPLDLEIRQTIAAPAFDKYYLRGPWTGCGLHPDIHHMKAPDLGAPHDHLWSFRSLVLAGSYVEEVFGPGGTSHRVTHRAGETFVIEAEHVHRIVDLPEGEAWTVILPLTLPRLIWGYWEWRDGRAWKRDHDKPDARLVGGEAA